jgi:hypothetical protein
MKNVASGHYLVAYRLKMPKDIVKVQYLQASMNILWLNKSLPQKAQK